MLTCDQLLELQADRLIIEAKRQEIEEAGDQRYTPEYPCYTEHYLAQKRTRHEDRYAELPEYEDPAAYEAAFNREVGSLPAKDLELWGDNAGLTQKQHFAWTLSLSGQTVADTCREWARKHGEELSYSTVKEWLDGARKKVIREASRHRHSGWYLVYLEEVTRLRQFPDGTQDSLPDW